jgi:hypothetical protein
VLNAHTLLCVGFCCSGTISASSGRSSLFCFQYAFIDVLVTCTDGSSCYGHFEVYTAGGQYEVAFSSNC